MARVEDNKVHCLLCGSATHDPIKLGTKIEISGVVVHFFCVALSTGIQHNDKISFLGLNIKEELKRGFKNKCAYCRLRGATIGCVKCNITFHLPCGQRNGAMSQLKHDLPSYCKVHRPKQKVLKTVMKKAKMEPQICVICYEEIDMKNPLDWIWPPCCRKYFYHRNCVQVMALNHGYHMKCCLCQNRDVFNNWIIEHGVYVPERDASWLSHEASHDDDVLIINNQILLDGYPVCKVEECLCPYGRATFKRSTIWERGTCYDCLQFFTHYRCSNIITDVDFKCPACANATTELVATNYFD